MNQNLIKITGYWGNEPIWRYKTPEEKLEESNIKVEEALLFITLNQNENN